jgi:site-specific DNA-adenine methylase
MPLPYHAGKSKLAKTISKMVYKKAEENPSIKNYAEPFSGMGRVGIKVMEDDKNKVFKKYYFTDVNPTISVLFKALKKGWLPKLENITQEKWESYKKNKKPSAQKSFVGYTLGFGGQYFGGKNVRTEKRSHGGKNFAVNYMKSKKKYLKELQPYFKSSKFSYKEKSVFDLDFKDTIIYCDPPYVSTVFRAKKIWNKEKENKFWNTIKKWLEPSKNNIVILSNSKRTNKMKGLRVKKIYEDDVGYGSWKANSKKRKEMIFEVVNSSGRKTRKKRAGCWPFCRKREEEDGYDAGIPFSTDQWAVHFDDYDDFGTAEGIRDMLMHQNQELTVEEAQQQVLDAYAAREGTGNVVGVDVWAQRMHQLNELVGVGDVGFVNVPNENADVLMMAPPDIVRRRRPEKKIEQKSKRTHGGARRKRRRKTRKKRD